MNDLLHRILVALRREAREYDELPADVGLRGREFQGLVDELELALSAPGEPVVYSAEEAPDKPGDYYIFRGTNPGVLVCGPMDARVACKVCDLLNAPLSPHAHADEDGK